MNREEAIDIIARRLLRVAADRVEHLTTRLDSGISYDDLQDIAARALAVAFELNPSANEYDAAVVRLAFSDERLTLCPECRALVPSLDDRAGHKMDCKRPYEPQRRRGRRRRQ